MAVYMYNIYVCDSQKSWGARAPCAPWFLRLCSHLAGNSLLAIILDECLTLFGERERANLVVSTADFSLYIFIYNIYFGRWTPPYRNVLRDSKYVHKCEIS